MAEPARTDAEKEAHEAVFAHGHMTVNSRTRTRSQAHRQGQENISQEDWSGVHPGSQPQTINLNKTPLLHPRPRVRAGVRMLARGLQALPCPRRGEASVPWLLLQTRLLLQTQPLQLALTTRHSRPEQTGGCRGTQAQDGTHLARQRPGHPGLPPHPGRFRNCWRQTDLLLLRAARLPTTRLFRAGESAWLLDLPFDDHLSVPSHPSPSKLHMMSPPIADISINHACFMCQALLHMVYRAPPLHSK